MYFSMVVLETLPAVDTKKDLVQRDGMRISGLGNSLLSVLLVEPLSACIIRWGDQDGSTLTNRWA